MRLLDQHLEIDDDGTVVCRKCAHTLGPATENYKTYAVRKDRPITDANPLIVDPDIFIDDEVVFRQYFCPGCATLLENEVILASSEPVWDKRLFLDGREGTPTATRGAED
jgi:N-methylhydantoinase B